MSILKRKPPEPQQPQQQQPTVVIQVQPQQPQPTVPVRAHTRHIPFIERPKDAEARQVIREAKLRKKLERKGLLPTNETAMEKMAKEAQDMSQIMETARRKQREFDET